ncbi:hypothetical protein SY88_22365 [Clostridiales bacterium PH28_bin88]|nr:hypothetical protein SY88_22365 [Clostridiales bacterium PH28_bin88]
MTNMELQGIVERISRDYFEKPGLVRSRFRHTARWNSRLSTTGGRYLPKTGDIEINPRQLGINGMSELEGIIKHELVHYHLHQQGLPHGHGSPYFKALLAQVGGHRYCQPVGVKKRSSVRYVYLCSKCGQQFTRRRKINPKKYICGKPGCGGKLVLAKSYRIEPVT